MTNRHTINPTEFRNDGGKRGGSFSSDRKSALQKIQNLAKTEQIEHARSGVVFGQIAFHMLIVARIRLPNLLHSTPLPKGTRTRFAKQTAAAKKAPKAKTKVTLTRVTRVQLAFPDQPFFDDLIRLLAETKCPIEADRKKLLLSYSKSNESLVNAALQSLKTQYQVKIQDVG